MVLKKKVVEGALVAGLLVIVTTTTAVTNHVVSNVSTNTKIAIAAQTNSTSAGIIDELGTQQMNYLVAGTKDSYVNQANAGVMKAVARNIQNASEASTITVTPSDVSLTASAAGEDTQQMQESVQPDTQAQEPTVQEAVSQNASNEATIVQNTDVSIHSDSVAAQIANEQAQWANKLMANVDQFLNVRVAQDENSEIVGKLYKGDSADVLEKGDVWTHIKSGSVDGYVMNQYCVFGVDAYNYAKANCQTEASATTGGLRLRSEPKEDASIVDLIAQGQVMTVSNDTPPVDGWIAIQYDNGVAYVSSTYVNVKLAVGTGITIAEEKAQQAAEEADKAKKEAKTVQKSAVAASGDEVSILAAVIQLEAGGEPYAGKVAVGSVVMNRVRSGRFANSISGVIYQSGQFSTAGSVASVATHGTSSSCRQAAQEAINGADNTGGCVSFRRASSGHGGLVIGNHVFF